MTLDLERFDPLAGTLLAFRRSDNSWHGHQPFAGERRVIQLNWLTDEEVVRREQNRDRMDDITQCGWLNGLMSRIRWKFCELSNLVLNLPRSAFDKRSCS